MADERIEEVLRTARAGFWFLVWTVVALTAAVLLLTGLLLWVLLH